MPRRQPLGLRRVARGLLALAMAGLLATAVDLGRVYVVRSEIQAYADAAARAAAGELDGTPSGIDRARHRVAGSSQRWKLTAAILGGAEMEFAASAYGPWQAKVDPTRPCRFIRVRATAAVPLLFLPALGASASRTVHADGIAGREDGETPLLKPVARSSTAEPMDFEPFQP